MAITINQNKLYTSDGKYLKTLLCRKRVSHSELEMKDDEYRQYHCAGCDKAIISTDMLTGNELEAVLAISPEACVYINPLNPIFNIILNDEIGEQTHHLLSI